MKINYLTGCAAVAALGLTLVGCQPKSTDTISDSETTNSTYSTPSSGSMSATNAAMSAMTNATDSSAAGDIRRGQYDTSLNTNLHNADMTTGGMTNMAGDMTNMVNGATNQMSTMTNSTM